MSVLPPYAGGVFSPIENVAGKPYVYWLAKWWQRYKSPWILRNRDPVFAVPGKLAEAEPERKDRYITVPRQKPLLFAILNWIATEGTEQEMIEQCRQKIDVVAQDKLRFTIDNDKIDIKNAMDMGKLAQRVKSDFFLLGKQKCVTEGYWLMLRPYTFAKGDYTIRSYGSCSSGLTQIGIDYHVFVR